MKKPFFSVVIPTYNRAPLLKEAIAATLEQTFRDFELIVVDDNSPDRTKKVVEDFKDKRIKYYKNRENLRTEANQKKAISLATGEYIFTLGDDDFILWKDTLEKVHNLLKKDHYGFIRLNIIEKRFNEEGIRKSIVSVENNIEIKPDENTIKILDFFDNIAAGHWSGLVFKNHNNISNDIIDCRVTEWIKILYEGTKKDGALFLGKYYIIISWSQAGIMTHYYVPPDRRLMFENYTDYIKTILSEKDYKDYLYNFCWNFIPLQPAAKLYSSNINLIKFNKRLFEIVPTLRKDFLFYIMFPLALIIPKWGWQVTRIVQHRLKNHLTKLSNYPQIKSRFDYVEKRHLTI